VGRAACCESTRIHHNSDTRFEVRKTRRGSGSGIDPPPAHPVGGRLAGPGPRSRVPGRAATVASYPGCSAGKGRTDGDVPIQHGSGPAGGTVRGSVLGDGPRPGWPTRANIYCDSRANFYCDSRTKPLFLNRRTTRIGFQKTATRRCFPRLEPRRGSAFPATRDPRASATRPTLDLGRSPAWSTEEGA
jgi:hypothetical protein